MNYDKLLPYIVPPAYVEHQDVSPNGLVRPLGHDAYVMLVEDLDGICRNVLPGDLSGSVDEAYARAIDNLMALVKAQDIHLGVVSGPRDLPIIVGEGHWTAASCILLPRLFELASERLSTDQILASVPSRGSLVVFPLRDKSYTREMRQFIKRAEELERKRVTDSLFKLTATGVEPFGSTLAPPRPSLLKRLFGA